MSEMAVDPFGGLEGADRDAAVALQNLMRSYGLETLAPKILDFIRQGYSADTVSILLAETSEYKQRFSANEKRRQAGLPVLSPAEYLAVEDAYREIMSSAGLPPGFYDQPEDFTKWIEGDVSPSEVKQRVDVAVEAVNTIDPAQRNFFRQWYSDGDMIAYALDRTRATAVLERQFRASQVGGAAATQGVSIDSGLAERLATDGVSRQQARQGFGIVAQETERAGFLSSLYGGDDVTQDDLTAEVFFDDQEAARKRRRLASQERASFGGSSGLGKSSLSRTDAGQI